MIENVPEGHVCVCLCVCLLQDPKVYVQTTLDVHKKYNALVMSAFNNDAGFVAALDKVSDLSDCFNFTSNLENVTALKLKHIFCRRAVDSSTTTPSPEWLSPPANPPSCSPDTAILYWRRGEGHMTHVCVRMMAFHSWVLIDVNSVTVKADKDSVCVLFFSSKNPEEAELEDTLNQVVKLTRCDMNQ